MKVLEAVVGAVQLRVSFERKKGTVEVFVVVVCVVGWMVCRCRSTGV
jgi:hypothetical protein